MSLETALIKFRDTMVVDGLPVLGEGLPGSYDNAVYPYFYLDTLDSKYEFDGHQKVMCTSSVARLQLFYGVDKKDMPSGTSWFIWPNRLAEMVMDRIIQCSLDGTYLQDGGQGFYANVQSFVTDFDPERPQCHGRIIVELDAFK